jgi:hypothetical protein
LSATNPPPFRKTQYHLNEFSSRNRPQNAEELFNLRHSILRVTIERAFAALKNRFKILDQKPFHTFPTQVKLVLACCIVHNWILGWGARMSMSQMRLQLLLMVWTLDMVSSRATFRPGRTRGTTGLSQCGCIEMMSSTVDIKARILHPFRTPLLNCHS